MEDRHSFNCGASDLLSSGVVAITYLTRSVTSKENESLQKVET
jgi:hypothetical protein